MPELAKDFRRRSRGALVVSVNKNRKVLTNSVPPVVGVRFTAEEYQSLLQIHRVYNFTRQGWTVPRIVREACKLAAILLSLPVPGSRHWPDPGAHREDSQRWTDAELTELITRCGQIRDEMPAERSRPEARRSPSPWSRHRAKWVRSAVSMSRPCR
jgi:hypothetical protein